MTNIADAIRDKTGETGLLTLDAMAAAIAAIEAGGGDGDGGATLAGYDVACGSFIPATDTNTYRILETGWDSMDASEAFCAIVVFSRAINKTPTSTRGMFSQISLRNSYITTKNDNNNAYLLAMNTTSYNTGSDTNNNTSFQQDGTIKYYGYGTWNFLAAREYFWFALREKI